MIGGRVLAVQPGAAHSGRSELRGASASLQIDLFSVNGTTGDFCSFGPREQM